MVGQGSLEEKNVEMLFLDVVGYSGMTNPQLKLYLKEVLPDIANFFVPHKFIELNTWGDAIIGVSQKPYELARLALDLRDFFKNRNWLSDNISQGLSCRIALHGGVVYEGYDPIRRRPGIVGSEVNLAARLEPVTKKGEVWVTEQFMARIKSNTDATLAFDDLGVQSLAKEFGSEKIFRLRRNHDPSMGPNEIYEKDTGTDTYSDARINSVEQTLQIDNSQSLNFLAETDSVKKIPAYVGGFWEIVNAVAANSLAIAANETDILVAYRIADIRKIISNLRQNPSGRIRLCFPDMWDDALLSIHQRKYHDRTATDIQSALKDSISRVIGSCEFEFTSDGQLSRVVPNDKSNIKCGIEVRLTPQRLTYAFYRFDNFAFVSPLDMKKEQKPSPLMWAFDKETAPETFENYITQFNLMFKESKIVFHQ